jgi:hypothetical protein
MTTINLPFAASATRRVPTADELANGYGCGDADLQLFDYLAWWLTGQVATAITEGGLTVDDALLPRLAQAIQSGRSTYAVATGTANAWTVAPSLAVPAYAAGRALWIIAPATNTSTTVNANVSGLGNRRIKKANGADPQVSDLVSGQAYLTLDDGTNIRVVSPLPSDRLAELYLGFHGDPVSQSFANNTLTKVAAYTGIVNNLPGASESAGIITIGTTGYYQVTANMAALMPTGSNYSYVVAVSKTDAGGLPTLSIAALPVSATTASITSTLAGGASGLAKLTAGDRVGAFFTHNQGSSQNMSISLDIEFRGS